MADLAVLNIAKAFMPFGAMNLLSGYDPAAKYPQFAAHVERVAQHVSVKAYLDKSSSSMNADPMCFRAKAPGAAPGATSAEAASAAKASDLAAELEASDEEEEMDEAAEAEFERQMLAKAQAESTGGPRKSRAAVSA